MKAKIDRIEFAKKVNKKQVREYYNYSASIVETSRLDIRGNKPEEIEFEVIKFLDNSYSNSLTKVEIVHGKGTGVLKQMVHEILKQHQGVRKYNFAKIEFGGEGVTEIYLK